MADLIRSEAVEKVAVMEGNLTSTMELKQEDAASNHELEQADLLSEEEPEQEDRLSNLPDDILFSILERLKLLEAARTSVLSRRWRYLFAFRSRIIIDLGVFCQRYKGSELTRDDLAQINASMAKATKSILAHERQCPINLLSLRFSLVEESIDIIHCVDNAMANREITSLCFQMRSDIVDVDCIEDNWITYGRRFMRFFYAGSRAFGGLNYLHIQCIRISIDDMASVLNTCNKLEHLCLHMCDCGHRSVLKVEHPQLTTFKISNCRFTRVELGCLPRLTCLTCHTWMPERDQYPLYFGYVPQLSTLILSNQGTIFHKNFQLSEFLSNVMVDVLELDFACEKIWIRPEAPKLVGPCLQNLRFLYLKHVHEECDLDWTMFFLEAAPLLDRLHIQVWDHTSCLYKDDVSKKYHQFACQKISDNLLMWEAPDDLKHYRLKELAIRGYQAEEKFTRYIKRVVEAAVNLEKVILFDSDWCTGCKFSPSTRYPRTDEERDLTRKQILQWTSSPIKVGIST